MIVRQFNTKGSEGSRLTVNLAGYALRRFDSYPAQYP